MANIIKRLGADQEPEVFSGKWEMLREIDAKGEGVFVFHRE